MTRKEAAKLSKQYRWLAANEEQFSDMWFMYTYLADKYQEKADERKD